MTKLIKEAIVRLRELRTVKRQWGLVAEMDDQGRLIDRNGRAHTYGREE